MKSNLREFNKVEVEDEDEVEVKVKVKCGILRIIAQPQLAFNKSFFYTSLLQFLQEKLFMYLRGLCCSILHRTF